MSSLPAPQNVPMEFPKPPSPADPACNNRELRRRRGLPNRIPKRMEEHCPRPDYVQYMEQLGPRPGESLLAFRKRMLMIIGLRALWAEYWHRCDGNQRAVARALGIGYNHVKKELEAIGLTREILNDHLAGKVKLA